MAPIAPSDPERKMGEKMDGDQNSMGGRTSEADQKQLDAGALFVLKSKGSWLHCGYHLTTSIVAPALLSLPLALAMMGWAAGVIFLLVAAVVTFYSYVLLSLVLEHHAQQGNRLLRFRDMAHHILGSFWGRYYIGPIQFLLCFAAIVAGILLAGITLKAIYLLEKPEGTMKLYQFIVFGGLFMLILAQIPSFHSLRHLNLISLILCLVYSACATASSIYVGHSSRAPQRDYSIPGNGTDRLFGVFTAISIIATTYGSGIIPEIQATAAPPVKGKMFKGLCLCYAVVISTFFSVAISGYWAFGNQAQSNILSNFFSLEGSVLIPRWFYMMINFFTIFQIFAVSVDRETGEAENGRHCPFFEELHSVFTERPSMHSLLLESEAGTPRSKKNSKRLISERLYDELSNDDEDDDDVDEERSNQSKRRKAEKGAQQQQHNRAAAGKARTADSIHELLQDFMQKQQQIESHWWETMERRAFERQRFEQEWRQSMEKLERERLMLERAWREREEQRRMREECRAEKRDALLNALLNKLI